jgi:putative SOS response-associated peptidase YedK
MPVFLNRSDFDCWLDPAYDRAEGLTSMLAPYPA